MNKQDQSKQPKHQGTMDPDQPEGQNPKAHDSPDHDEHHDESRRNMFDPEVAKSLKIQEKKR